MKESGPLLIMPQFYLNWSPNIFSVMDILISLLIIFIFNFDTRDRVKCLLNHVFKRRDDVKAFCPLMRNVWDKVLKKNMSQHFNYFILVNSFFFLAFLLQEDLKAQHLFTTVVISALLFLISYLVSEKELINYREKYLKRNIK
jgi:putative flippase GtrA